MKYKHNIKLAIIVHLNEHIIDQTKHVSFDDTHKLHFVSSSIQKQVQEMPWRAMLADWGFSSKIFERQFRVQDVCHCV